MTFCSDTPLHSHVHSVQKKGPELASIPERRDALINKTCSLSEQLLSTGNCVLDRELIWLHLGSRDEELGPILMSLSIARPQEVEYIPTC